MGNALLLTLCGLVIAVAAYWLGGAMRAHELEADHAAERLRNRSRWRSDLDESLRAAHARAFERAAEAVGMWPHRVTRRADLMRHIDSLGQPSAIAGLPAEVSEFDASPGGEPPDDPAAVESYRMEGIL